MIGVCKEIFMKIVRLEETQKFENSKLCIATEYAFGDKDIDIATAEINGKYQKKIIALILK